MQTLQIAIGRNLKIWKLWESWIETFQSSNSSIRTSDGWSSSWSILAKCKVYTVKFTVSIVLGETFKGKSRFINAHKWFIAFTLHFVLIKSYIKQGSVIYCCRFVGQSNAAENHPALSASKMLRLVISKGRRSIQSLDSRRMLIVGYYTSMDRFYSLLYSKVYSKPLGWWS